MKKEIIIGIYRITSPAGKIYIGQSIDINKRWYDYKCLLCKNQPKLYNSFKKYGVENHKFDIVHICEYDISILEYWEDYYINLFNATNRDSGLNLRGGGKHGKVTEESKEKNRQSHLGKVNILSKEALERREKRKAETKLRREEENKIKKEIRRIEKLNKPKIKRSEEYKKKISNTLRLIGGNRTPESIKKQKETWNKKRSEGKIIFTDEHRKKLSKAGRKRPVSIKTLTVLSRNWIKGRSTIVKGRKMDEQYRSKIKIGWIKRRKNMDNETKIFNNLSKEEQSVVICILIITRMLNRNPKMPKKFIRIRYGATAYKNREYNI